MIKLMIYLIDIYIFIYVFVAPSRRYEIEYIGNRIYTGHSIGRRFLGVEPQQLLRNGSGGGGGGDADIDGLDAETREELLLNSSNANPTETAETENRNNTTANNCNNIKNSNHKKLQQQNDTHNHNGEDAGLALNGDDTNDVENDGDEGVVCDSSQDAEKSGGGIVGTDGGETVTRTGTGLGSDELVLDVLNDDLIAQVRNKLNSGGKDLFAHCVKAVKAFLAGEPFREFENSMYFHR